ncbi:MAG TPA: M23 family metallopeptidase [Gemmatimonadota bacterium]|nr:M23 family metallopeptidase [Gemmatimonadota bacterium]
MKGRLSGILGFLPAPLMAVTGFMVGGAFVALAVGLVPGCASSVQVARPSPSLDPLSLSPGPAKVPRPRSRTPLPSPDHPARAPVGEPIGADSLAALVEVLRERDFEVPVDGVDADDLMDDFYDPRSGGRTHEALDILAPRGTPVVAVEDGTIASLDPSQGGGGIVVYQFDPSGEFVYYYAHLDAFAPGLAEGQPVEKGDLLGYVGTSGNAPPDTPHLHFAIAKTPAPFRHYGGTAINPFEILR